MAHVSRPSFVKVFLKIIVTIFKILTSLAKVMKFLCDATSMTYVNAEALIMLEYEIYFLIISPR